MDEIEMEDFDAGGQKDIDETSPASGLEGKKPKFIPNGRPRGVPNKITRTFKAAAETAFDKGGGVDWLVSMMKGTASDRAAVLGLFGRLIPHQLVGEVNHQVKVELSWLGGRNIGKSVMDMESPADQAEGHADQALTDGTTRQVPAMRLSRDETIEDVRVKGED